MSWNQILDGKGGTFEDKSETFKYSKVSKVELTESFEAFEGGSPGGTNCSESIENKFLVWVLSKYNIYNNINTLDGIIPISANNDVSPYQEPSSKVSKVKTGSLAHGRMCLAGACGLAEYRFEDGIDRSNCEVLWCRKVDSAVIDLASCPDKRWIKDEKGWTHERNKNGLP